MTLLDLVKDNLRTDDKEVASNVDLEKSNDEIVASMITAGLIKFDDTNNDD